MNRNNKRILRKIINASKSGHDTVMSETLGIQAYHVRVLAAHGVITAYPLDKNKFAVALTEKGMVFFENESKENRTFWKNQIVSFLGGLIVGAAVGVITTLLTLLLTRQP